MPRSGAPDLSPLAARIHAELLAARKTSEGWTVATAGLYPGLCSVLGGGDPHVAFAALRIAVLSLIDSTEVVAAAASLGLTIDSPTHTDRLNEAGLDLGLGERQVRRMSDQGLLALARFITTNWAVRAVPTLSLTAIRTGEHSADVAIAARRLLIVEMSDPVVTVNGRTAQLELETEVSLEDIVQRSVHHVSLDEGYLEIELQWRGELWPRFAATFVGPWNQTSSMSLGNGVRLSAKAR